MQKAVKELIAECKGKTIVIESSDVPALTPSKPLHIQDEQDDSLQIGVNYSIKRFHNISFSGIKIYSIVFHHVYVELTNCNKFFNSIKQNYC